MKNSLKKKYSKLKKKKKNIEYINDLSCLDGDCDAW